MENSSKSLTANTLFYMLYCVLNIVFPFFTGIYVARVLLPSSIGQVEAARNLAQYFVIFSFLGIPTYSLREIPKIKNKKDEKDRLFSELIVLNSISTMIFLLLYLFIVFSIPQYRANLTLYLITGISIALNFFDFSWLYEALEHFDFISIRNLVFKTLSFILLLIFVRDTSDVYNYALITVVGTAGNCLLNVINARKYVSFTLRGLNIRRHLKSVFILVVVNLAIEIYSLVDITMLNLMCKPEIVAYYSYGNKIYGILKTVINSVTMVLVPRIAALFDEGKQYEFNSIISKAFLTIILLALPMIVGIYFVSDEAICLVYGNLYSRSSVILRILSFMLIISPVGYLLGSRIMLVTNHENRMVIPVAIGATTNIIANYYFIQIGEEVGAAIASVLSEIAVMFVYICLSKRFIHLSNVKNSIFLSVLSAGIMGLGLFLFSLINLSGILWLIIEIVFGIVLYFGSLLLFKEKTVYGYYRVAINKMRRSIHL